MKITTKCLCCPELFEISPSQIKYGKGKYCSRLCVSKGRRHLALNQRASLSDLSVLLFSKTTTLTNGCIVFNNAKDKDGYGVFSYKHKVYRTHRLSYEIKHGMIPNGLFIMHTCDNPSCVNPDHLRAGTHADNMADMVAKGRGRGKDKFPRIKRLTKKDQ